MYYHCTISLYMLNTIWDNHCLLWMCPTLFIPYSTTLYQRKKCDCIPLLQHRSYGIPFFFSFNSNCRHICRKKLRVFLYYNIVFFFIAPTLTHCSDFFSFAIIWCVNCRYGINHFNLIKIRFTIRFTITIPTKVGAIKKKTIL
jgi:hypothetical protein